MSFRRRKQTKTHTALLPIPTNVPPAVTAEETDKGPVIPVVIIASVEGAADRAKRELTDTGKTTPKALFVYDGQVPLSDSMITVVSLAWRTEFLKDALWKKIKDKALQENARAVVVMVIGPVKRKGLLTVYGMTRETEIGAWVGHAFDRDTKTVGRWELRWPNETPGDTLQDHVSSSSMVVVD